MDKILRNTLIVGVIIVSLSVVYYFVFLPIDKKNIIKKCDTETENLVGWNSSRGGFIKNESVDKFKDEFERCLRKNGF